MTATDKDEGQNAVVRYSIVPDAMGKSKCFKIGKENGVISTNCELDREVMDTYSILVRATDQGDKISQKYVYVVFIAM